MLGSHRIYSPIASVELVGDGELRVTFTSGASLFVTDEAQYCCERRYITCDDDLSSFVGASVLDVVIRDSRDLSRDEDGDCHEAMFVDIVTTSGPIQLCTHNEHNGYYGGFDVQLTITSTGGAKEVYDNLNGNWRKLDE